VILLNVAAALMAGGRADHLGEAVPLAAESIDSGAAKKRLEELVRFTNAPEY
jgi:anthranilate phosphoribosyltransferase